MTDPQGQSPVEPELTEEEMKAQLEAAQAKLVEAMGRGEKDFGEAQALARTSLQRVEEELKSLEATLGRLERYKDHPEGGYHYANILALVRAKTAHRKLLQIELACLEHNMALATGGPPEDWEGEGSPFRDAEADPGYGLARATMDYYLAGFYWLRHLEHADTLLRAAGDEPAVVPHNEAEEALRAERAEKLKALMAGDPEAQRALVRLTEEMRLTQALLPWAKEALAGLEAQPAAERRKSLQDPDWKKLNGVMHALENLPASLTAVPALAAFDFGTPQFELEDPLGDIVISI